VTHGRALTGARHEDYNDGGPNGVLGSFVKVVRAFASIVWNCGPLDSSGRRNARRRTKPPSRE
jgi:hypothetical protein